MDYVLEIPCMFSIYFIRCLQKLVKLLKVGKTTFLYDQEILRFIQMKNKHAMACHNQTCVAYSCIPKDSSSKVTLDSRPFYPGPSFQFSKKKCGNRERPCQANWFQ